MAKKTSTETPAKKAAKGKAAPAKEKRVKAKPTKRGPLARVKELHGTKEGLVKAIVGVLARQDENADELSTRLQTASNQQLLRLAKVVETVKKKYGTREKLVSSLTNAVGRAKDSDYVTKLQSLSLPKLLDLASSAERRAKHAA